VVLLIGLLVLTIVLFGTAAADGPLQVALFLSATFAGLVACKNGYTAVAIEEAAVGGVSSAMGAIFILLAVGALIGTWNLAGTIPTIVSYGLALLRPAIFFATIAVICAVVGAVTGSSWTTAATLGVALTRRPVAVSPMRFHGAEMIIDGGLLARGECIQIPMPPGW
jgi:NhaC family Na+:H+ antiporter